MARHHAAGTPAVAVEFESWVARTSGMIRRPMRESGRGQTGKGLSEFGSKERSACAGARPKLPDRRRKQRRPTLKEERNVVFSNTGKRASGRLPER